MLIPKITVCKAVFGSSAVLVPVPYAGPVHGMAVSAFDSATLHDSANPGVAILFWNLKLKHLFALICDTFFRGLWLEHERARTPSRTY